MSGAQEQLEIKFRLIDGSDIGPKSFPVAMSVATLKENIIAQWPKGSIKLSNRYDSLCVYFYFYRFVVWLCLLL